MEKRWDGFKPKFFTIFGLVFFLFFATSSPASAECYAYDDLGRLISVVYDTNAAKRTYNLDEHGNRTTVEDVASTAGACGLPSGIPSDGATSAAITVGNTAGNTGGTTNTPPVTDNENVVVFVGTSQIVLPLDGDSDADLDTLTLDSITYSSSFFTATQLDNSVTITAYNTVGADDITYVVSDGNGGTATGTISVLVTVPINLCVLEPNLPGCSGGNGGQVQ